MFSREHSIIHDCELSVSLIVADRDCLINGLWSAREGEMSPRGPAAFCTLPYIRIWKLAALLLNCCADCRIKASFLLIFRTDSNASVLPSRYRLRFRPSVHEDFRSLCDRDVFPHHSKYAILGDILVKEIPICHCWSHMIHIWVTQSRSWPRPEHHCFLLYLTSLPQLIRLTLATLIPQSLSFFFKKNGLRLGWDLSFINSAMYTYV